MGRNRRDLAAGLGTLTWMTTTSMLRCLIFAAFLATPALSQERFRDCESCPEMAVIPGGDFVMGSPKGEWGRSVNEGPPRSVRIAPFAIGVFEVTFEEWDACARDGGCREIRRGGYWEDGDQDWGRGRRPVITVTWTDAQSYIAWLNEQIDGAPYRLPSEAEWEYAARANTSTSYSWGNDWDDRKAKIGGGSRKTGPVGRYAANGFGLYDVHGNVQEWVQDCWNSRYSGAPDDGAAWTDGDCTRRVLRGGSWSMSRWDLRSARRRSNPSDLRDYGIGFRVARTLGHS